MKGKIDKKGLLYLQRGSEEKAQMCPWTTELEMPCGDWCPLFGEPVVAEGTVVIRLHCAKTAYFCWDFKEFEDQRDI